jgi:WD40 repeat protein
LLAVNDESARLTLAYPNGRNISFTRIISFQPPQTFVAFSAKGWYVTGESAPGFPSLVNRFQPNDSNETLAKDIEWVSGVAVAPDDSIYVSATKDGRIFHTLPDGTREILAEGLKYPEGLALSADGTLYAVVGGQGFSDVFPIPGTGDEVISITADGQITKLARLQDAAEIAIGPDGLLYVAAGNSVYRLSADGKAEVFTSGFQAARGVAFDIAGNLYVADDNGNNIARISGIDGEEVHGRVLDFSSGMPVTGAFVRVTRVSPPYMGQLAMTANDGTFSILALAGEYTVTGWADGYQVTSFTITDIANEVVVELLPK